MSREPGTLATELSNGQDARPIYAMYPFTNNAIQQSKFYFKRFFSKRK